MLRVVPDGRNQWAGERRHEIQSLINGCDWFKVYDLIEALHIAFAQSDENSGEDNAGVFAREINEFFIEKGIGWQISREKSLREAAKRLKRW